MSRCRSNAPRRSSPRWSSCTIREACRPTASWRSRPARPWASPRSRRRPGCAGSAASGCGHWPSGCRDFSGIDEVAPPAGLQTELRPYQRDGSRLAAVSARLRARRHPRRRYGARQDRAGARSYPGREARGPARPAVPGRLPDQRRAELAGRGGAAGAGTAGPVVARRRPRAALRRDRRQRSGGDDLCAAVARCRPAAAGRLAYRRARRGAGDQERRGEDDAARLPARRAPSAVPDRDADGEPSRRAVVAIRLSDAGAARRRQALCAGVPHADREEAGRRAARACWRRG